MKGASKIVLGVDPGITYSGYGLVELTGNRITHILSGTIGVPKSQMKLPERIKYHFDKLNEIINEFDPSDIALEQVFYSRNVKMAIELSHIRGALILSAKLKGLGVFEYSPTQIKQAVTGYGKAAKPQITKMVKTILKNPPIKDSHSSDALAAAICHSHCNALSRRIQDIYPA